MKQLVFFALFIPIIFLIGCAGKDSMGDDHTPPAKANLINHLGDAGDSITVNGQLIYLTDNNNGMDAVTDDNWMKITWEPLIDTDVRTVRVYRYQNGMDTEPTLIDSVDSDITQYIDKYNIASDAPALNTDWYYYLQVVDNSGNSTFSDTVHYQLLDKPILESPTANQQITSSNNLVFRWDYPTQCEKFRVMLFNISNQIIWYKDEHPVTANDFYLNYTGGALPIGQYYWRVDAFDAIMGDVYYSGSESKTRSFRIVP